MFLVEVSRRSAFSTGRQIRRARRHPSVIARCCPPIASEDDDWRKRKILVWRRSGSWMKSGFAVVQVRLKHEVESTMLSVAAFDRRAESTDSAYSQDLIYDDTVYKRQS